MNVTYLPLSIPHTFKGAYNYSMTGCSKNIWRALMQTDLISLSSIFLVAPRWWLIYTAYPTICWGYYQYWSPPVWHSLIIIIKSPSENVHQLTFESKMFDLDSAKFLVLFSSPSRYHNKNHFLALFDWLKSMKLAEVSLLKDFNLLKNKFWSYYKSRIEEV